MQEIWNSIRGLITTDNIAFLSVLITLLIFAVSRRAEIRYKKHDDKKIQYLKLIALLEQIFMYTKKDEKEQMQLTDELKKEFFDLGASLLLYGSKKLYRQYLFYREFSSNPLIKQCKYFKDDLILYIMSEILLTMRREVGLNSFNNLNNNEALGFFVNDITRNPVAKITSFNSKFRIRMIKFELGIIDRTKFVFLRSFFYTIIKPIFGIISILFKHIILIPCGRIIMKMFPDFVAKAKEQNK